MGLIKPDQPGRHPPAKPAQPTRTYQQMVNKRIIRELIFYGWTTVLPNTRPAWPMPTQIITKWYDKLCGSDTPNLKLGLIFTFTNSFYLFDRAAQTMHSRWKFWTNSTFVMKNLSSNFFIFYFFGFGFIFTVIILWLCFSKINMDFSVGPTKNSIYKLWTPN